MQELRRTEERRGCRGQRERTKAGENGEKKRRRKGVKEGVKHSETDMTKEGNKKGRESGEYEVFQGFM